MNRLDNKVAFITGTGSGQGRAAALLFAQQGAKVVGSDVNAEGAEATSRLVTDAGGSMVSLAPVDMADPAGAAAFVAAGLEAYGGIDILYNNAGAARVSAIEDCTLEDWEFTIRNELNLVFVVTKAAWPHLIERGGGSIINTASRVAVMGPAYTFQPAHGAAKGGVLAFTLHMAAAGAGHGIRANAILPGLIRTPAATAVIDWDDPGSIPEQLAATNPLRRNGTPEDVAKLALFLASDDSAYINAEAIRIDGGQTVVMP